MSNPNIFKHSGDLGDIIFSLPTIRALGGGQLYLDPTGGLKDPLVKWADRRSTKLGITSIEFITPLLERQEYITKVGIFFDSLPITHNLNEFRQHVKYNNLSDSHLSAFGLNHDQRNEAWIKPLKPKRVARFIMSRSFRYQGNHGFWENYLPLMEKDCAFIGFEDEHEVFQKTFMKKVPLYKVKDVEDMVNVIAGSDMFVSNQGFPHSLAEAMKHNLTLEVYPPYPSVVFQRPGAQYV